MWLDTNANGRQDAGEAGVNGVAVTLLTPNGKVLATTTTANKGTSAGYYAFTGLIAGDYVVRFGNSDGTTTYTRTAPRAAGVDTTLDSNADAATGLTPTVTLVAGQFDPTIDAGLTLLAAVGDTVWYDVNKDGTQQAGEPGLPGVTVTLDYAGLDGKFGTADDVLGTATQKTDASGKYFFGNLTPGTYRAQVNPATLPDGLAQPTYDLDGLPTPNVAGFTLVAAQTRLDVDFGYVGTASLGDTVWIDLNRDGVQQADEPGIAGAKVTLVFAGLDGTLGTADDITYPAQLTGADGKYLFTNLPAGAFRATVDTSTLPLGIRSATYDLDSGTTAADSTAATTLTVGQARRDVDFGYTGTSALGDRVWLDTNGDGKQDPGEPGIPGVTVTLTWNGPNGVVTRTTTTGPDGIYNFVSLPPGQYTVAVSGVPGGLTQTGDPQGPIDNKATVTLPVATTIDTLDFGYQGNTSVAGHVYVDRNDNGVFEASETPIAGTTVTLTGTDVLGNAVTRSTTTAADGTYSFVSLVPGTYSLAETQPAAWGDGKDTLGSAGGTVANDLFSGITLTAGQAGVNYDFGERPGVITGTTFVDLNRDGQRTPDEPVNPGVVVALRDGTGAVVATTTTDAQGNYRFDNLPQGNYTVTETQPNGYGDPQVGPFSPNSRPVALPPGGAIVQQNYGDTLSSLTGLVFADGNNNGVREPNEPGIGGVTVTLTGTDAQGTAVSKTTTTAADGTYSFPNLVGGTYTVTETQPPQYGNGQNAVGSVGGTLRPTDIITAVSLPGGTDAVRYNFGEVTSSVTGVSYQDVNRDGTYQPGIDKPLVGTVVTLKDAQGNTVATTTTGADGTYSFVGLPAGQYSLTETQPAGYGNGEAVTNVRRFSLDPAMIVSAQNFGNTLGSVAGVVYVDRDNSGALSAGDTNLAGVTVTLVDAAGKVVATATTGADGAYKFDNLPLGSYTIRETQPVSATQSPNGYYDGSDNPGSLGGTSPVKNTLAVTIGIDAAGLGQVGTQYNFGETLPASLFGSVYVDVNNNGLRDPGEPGIAGVAITISGAAFAGTPQATPLAGSLVPNGLLSVTTDADGNYQFAVLPPGVYSVNEAQPAAYLDGRESNRQVGAPNPPTVGNDVFSNVVLGGAVLSRGSLDFGEITAPGNPSPLPPLNFFPPVIAPTPDVSKRQFLGSTTMPATAGLVPATTATVPNFSQFGATATRRPKLVTTAQDAGQGWVRVFDFGRGEERFRFQPYGDFTGGVRVVTADVNGDGIADIITAPGVGGGPVVKIFDGSTGELIRSLMAFDENFRGGLQLTAGDLDGDGKADIIVTPDAGGGPIVRAYSGANGAMIANFFALDETFRGGLRIAAADINADKVPDLLVTAGVGGGPRIAGYDGKTLTTTPTKLFADFFGFAPELRDGFWISGGDVDGDGYADIAYGAGNGGAPRVDVYSGKALATGQGKVVLGSFYAGDAAARTGARVLLTDLNGDGKAEAVAGAERGSQPVVGVYDPVTGERLDQFMAFPVDTLGGVYVG